jgi:hypothetical protein
MVSRILLLFIVSLSVYAVNPGDVAPDFSLYDHKDNKIKLSKYKGKYIVLEWFNSGCPFVKKHYESGNMQSTQALYLSNSEVVWLTIISSAKGKQGYINDSSEAKLVIDKWKMKNDHMLFDKSGDVGQLYGAKTTPHMFIIKPNFKVGYVGAIDSIASANPKDIKDSTNYVTSSISKMMLKERPSPQKTQPYGCSVKY